MLPVMRRRDPAPSRIKYRLERLWLTPGFRRFIRVGLPLLTIVGLAAGALSQPQVRAAGEARFNALRQTIAAHPGLQVEQVSIAGASEQVTASVREALQLELPVSSIDLDLADLHARVTRLDPVAAAHVRLEAGGILRVSVKERVPAAVWRGEDGFQTLDLAGNRVRLLASRAAAWDLPLIMGDGADAAVPEALEIMATAGPLRGRVRGLLRVGQRRWDVLLDRDQRILLPEAEPAAALARIIALEAADDILGRDVIHVDLRDRRRPTLRLTERAVEQMHERRGAPEEGT